MINARRFGFSEDGTAVPYGLPDYPRPVSYFAVAPRLDLKMSEFDQESFDGAADKMAADMTDGRSEGRAKPRRRRKVSFLTLNKIDYVDYKDIATLQKFVSERGKILSSRQTGNTAKQQRMISNAIKSAREMALLPFVVRETVDSGPRRRTMGDRPERTQSDEAPARAEEQQETAAE